MEFSVYIGECHFMSGLHQACWTFAISVEPVLLSPLYRWENSAPPNHTTDM